MSILRSEMLRKTLMTERAEMDLMQAVEHYATAMKLAERYGNKNGDMDAANNAWHECKKAADELAELRAWRGNAFEAHQNIDLSQEKYMAKHGLMHLLERSAELLERSAEEIKIAHTIGGRWCRHDEHGAHRDHKELREMAKGLRKAHAAVALPNDIEDGVIDIYMAARVPAMNPRSA